jgi:prepilin-type N-terminal cleavage/methylation domain-containing protein
MSRIGRVRRRESGFTLIEVMAALLIFALITLGITPLLLSSIRGSALSRSFTVGKNFALEAMERVRGLPYHIDYSAQAPGRRVDVLDLYYPNYEASGTFTTTCTAATMTVPACPKRLPTGYTLKFKTTFVKPTGTLEAQTYSPVPASSSPQYVWNPTTTSQSDLPPSQVIEMVVRADWTQAGRSKNFEIKTLIGDRVFGDIKIKGSATVDYGVQVQTGYADPTGALSSLIATGVKAESQIESKTAAVANQTVRSAELRLVEVPPDSSSVGADIAFVEGAKGVLHAPPPVSPPNTSVVAQTLTHPNLDPATIIAGIETSATDDLDVAATNDLPLANGGLLLGDSGSVTEDLWVRPQVSSTKANALHLSPSGRMVSVKPDGADVMTGRTTAISTDLTSADPKVEATAAVDVKAARLLPTTFIPSPSTDGAVVVIDNFVSSVSCKSSGSSGLASTATWSADVSYWKADAIDDGLQDGGAYETVSLNGASASDQLADIRADNPLVYDGPTPATDVYLFEDVTKTGYLSGWGSLFNASSTGVTQDSVERSASSAIDGALSISTVPTGDTAESSVKVELGKLNCEAVDAR